MIEQRMSRGRSGGKREKRMVRRSLGFVLVGVGGFGLILSIAGLLGVWWLVVNAQGAIDHELAILDQSLLTTRSGLTIADEALDEANLTLDALVGTLNNTTQAITDTVPTLTNVGNLAGSELPNTIRSTQAALGSARETARVVDRVLGTISGLGLLTSATYNPAVPLNEAIGQVSSSLDALPASLEQVSLNINQSATTLERLNSDLSEVTSGVAAIGGQLDAAGEVIGQYDEIVSDLRTEIGRLRSSIPSWINGLGIGVSLLFIWIALAQIAVFAQAREMMAASPKDDD